MAGDWIKAEKSTPRKPEVLRIAAALGIDPDHAFGKCFRFWSWCDDHFASDGESVTEKSDVSLPGVTSALLDSLAGGTGFTKAMLEVGWLKERRGVLEVPNFDRHLSQSAKARGLAAKRMEKHRLEKRDGASVTSASPEKRGARGEKSIHSREDRSGEPLDQSRGCGNSSKAGKPAADALELPPDFDWEEVKLWASAAGQRVVPRSDEDRRAWLRYAVMAKVMFSEGWLIGAAEQAKVADTKKTRQSHFVAVLKATAKDSQDMDAETFNGIAARIEIPGPVWKSNILLVEKKR